MAEIECSGNRVFSFDGVAARRTFQRQGFVHVSNAVSSRFLSETREQTATALETGQDLKKWRFQGKKRQVLFDYGTTERLDEFRDVVAQVGGLDRARVTLCERHIKVYDEDAAARPHPHKDRLASQVNVGIPLKVATGSHLVLYPHDDIGRNPYNSTAKLRRVQGVGGQSPARLRGVSPVEVNATPGDLVIFRGSAIYHERMFPAGSWLLYLKFNDLRLDPLGEDPRTEAESAHTQRLVATLTDLEMLDRFIEVSPKVDHVQHYFSRDGWEKTMLAGIGDTDIVLDEAGFQLVKLLSVPKQARDVIEHIGAQHIDVQTVRQLAGSGVLNIL